MNKKTEGKPILSIADEIRPEQLLKKLHSFEGRLAAIITGLSGSMPFVYLHIIAFTLFFILKPFQIEIFNVFLSLEAVFLATFIMVAQNRQALIETYKELEEEKEEQEAEEEVEDIQKDLDDIKNAISFIQQKITQVEKAKENAAITNGGASGSGPAAK